MRKLFLSLAACASMLSASATGTWQLGPYAYTADTLFHSTTGPGITTTGVRLSSSNGSNKTNIFYSTIDLTNPNLELRGVQAKDGGNRTETVKAMGDRKNGMNTGHYLAGVNADFFNNGAAQGSIYTNGHSLVDGQLFNTAAGGDSWAKWGSYATVTGAKDIIIDTGVKAGRTMKFPNGQSHAITSINGGRWDNCLVIFTPAKGTSTGTNQWGRECQMKLVSGSIENNDAVFEVTSEVIGNTAIGDPNTMGNMAIPADGFVLSGTGSAYTLMGTLKVGDKLSISHQVTYNGKTIEPTQSVGGCSMIVMEGKIAPDEYFSKTIIDHFVNKEARTVIGYNEDRTKLIILVADKHDSNTASSAEKRSYGATSTGMVLQRMGHIMLHLGCYTAMNFDGGGSSELYNKELGIRNVPYGADYLRPVANGFFAVDTTPVDNEVAMIEVYQKNVKLTDGEKFTPTVFGFNKYGVLVNKNVTGFSLSVAPTMGTVSGTTFTAGSEAATTKAVVTYNGIKCGVDITTNNGKVYVSSGDDDVNVMIKAPYIPDEALGIDRDPIYMTEQWCFTVDNVVGDWDGTAPNWESEDAIKSKACPRFATARNGRFYTVDMRSMSIAEITPEGEFIPLYKLPSLEGRTINGIPDYYGTAISSDDAGNFLIGHLFTKSDAFRVWTIYCPKTGTAKHFEVELPEGEKSNGRIDNLGRVVGDLTNEAYAFVAPVPTAVEDSQKPLILHFKYVATQKPDVFDINNVQLTATMGKFIYMAGNGKNYNSNIQPRYTTVEEMNQHDINDCYYWYSKVGGLGEANQDLFTRNNGAMSKNYAADWNNISRLNGFDTFVLNGKRYFAVAYNAPGGNTSDMSLIVKDEDGTTVAEWSNPDFKSYDLGYNSITAVPVSSDQVNIYVYDYLSNKMSGALITLTLGGPYTPDEPVDITPSGLDFGTYKDGQPFKIRASESNGGWSAPAGMPNKYPNAFEEDGQLTVYLDRGAELQFNTADYVENTIQPAYAVRWVSKEIGWALVVCQPYSPYVYKTGWPAAAHGGTTQLNFYMDNSKITNKPDQRHYIRVRVVYNVLFRGCHYLSNPDLKTTSIYATHSNNYVVPTNDAETGNLYATTGIDFAKWVGETGRVEDIPAHPEVYVPQAGDYEPFDLSHNDGIITENHAAYLLNDSRYRIYEFDTYIDKPSVASLSAQFNMANHNANYLVKHVDFTDLGTDEARANLLGKRNVSWRYYNELTPTGIEEIVNDDAYEYEDAPAIYYNLQGVEVRNPGHGIYIVRRGNKVTKELIR